MIPDQDKTSQKLNFPKEPPLVATGETSRLVFHVSPLSGQGLFSQQTREAIKAILKMNGGSTIVHIRAFSAGNGDVRRIPQIVSDTLADKHGPLPSVSVVQVGALSLHDAQIVLESVSLSKKEVNKNGLTFHAAEIATAPNPAVPLETLLQKSVDQLSTKMTGKTALMVTCMVSDLDGAPELLRILTGRFPGSATNLVQSRRLAWQTEASCEGVSSGGGLTTERVAFSGTQVAFGVDEKDAAVAVQRLDRALSEAGAQHVGETALLNLYLMSPATAAAALKQLNGAAPVSTFPVEGVGPASAGFALDAVAPIR